MSTNNLLPTKTTSSTVILETPDEKKFRTLFNSGSFIAFLAIAGVVLYFVLPILTEMVNNAIDFGIGVAKLAALAAVLLFVFGTLFALRSVLYARWQSMVIKIRRQLIKTDLPGLLEVAVQNRQAILQGFGDSVKKMLNAIGLHTKKLQNREEKMRENLAYAETFKKKAQDTGIPESERKIAADNSRYHASEAARDKNALEKMMEQDQKMRKSYDFFKRLHNNLINDTRSITNEVERMRDELQTSETWRDAASNAVKLLGVSNLETMTFEETRNRIAENEAAVVNMIYDHQQLLEKMEMKQEMMDAEGEKLLEQYSQNIDVFSFIAPPTAEKIPATASGSGSFLKNYGNLLNPGSEKKE